MSPLGAACAVYLLLVVLIAVFADVLAPYDPLLNNYSALVSPPSEQFRMGTDSIGRDALSRLLFGTRITLIVAVVAVAAGGSVGFLFGVVTAYVGGRLDLISQRIVDVMLSFPTLILALLLMTGLGSGIHTVIIAISVSQIPRAVRVIRSAALSVREMTYVDAARVVGLTDRQIMLRYIAPQCVSPMLVIVSLNLGQAIFAESALSFLGGGVPPPTPSLGNMLGEQVAQAFRPPWWMVMFPGMTITSIILAANLFGDGLRDFLDPKLRQR